MRDNNYIAQDNRGSTLILVVTCIAFIAILGSLILSSTVRNLKSTDFDQKETRNFYETETALDEIKAGLEEVTGDALEEAYTFVMENYLANAYKTGEEKEAIFARKFVDILSDKLKATEDGTMYDISLLEEFIIESKASLDIEPRNNILTKDQVDPLNPRYIILENVQVRYRDGKYIRTIISSDIRINTPSVSLALGKTYSPIFATYGLIADKQILLDSAEDVMVSGDAYAGSGGISINNSSQITFHNSSNIITRGNIEVGDRSILNIKDNPSLWAKNIETLKSKDLKTSNPTIIDIRAKTYVADDLTLNGKNSEVTMEGKYYGYNYQGDGVPSEEISSRGSSAIIINGLNSSLDLSGIDQLVIAGRAYLDPRSAGNVAGGNDSDIYTGEALAIKGNQYAYLVPEEYIWAGTNPVSLEDYYSRPSEVLEVDYNKDIDNSIDFKDYVDGYSKIFYKAASRDLIYYYLKFKSEEMANRYLEKYYETYNYDDAIGIVDNRIKPYGKNISIPNTVNVLSRGNLFTYNDVEKSGLIINNVNPDPDFEDNKNPALQALEDLSIDLTKRYNNISRTLREKPSKEPHNKDSLFDTIIDTDKLSIEGVRVLVQDEYVLYIVNNQGASEFVLNGDEKLPGGGKQGIVIASGSVRVNDNFTGLILSGDTIRLRGGVRITASKDVVNKILSSSNPEINDYFRQLVDKSTGNDKGSGDDFKVNIPDLVVIENWEKKKY